MKLIKNTTGAYLSNTNPTIDASKSKRSSLTTQLQRMVHVSDQNQEDTAVTAVAVGKDEEKEETILSIYDTHSKSKKKLILFIISFVGFLSAFDEVVYLPALPVLVKDFNTTETFGLLTISLYLLAISLSGLIWGVLSDYYGRKPITIIGLGAFILSSIGCYFSPNIYVFLVCRTLQGCLVSVTIVVGQGTIADLYQPNDRGNAYGIFYAFYFFAGLFGPALGGQVSQHYGWRSTFILVAIISLVLFISYILIVPETQQYKVLCMYQHRWKITLLESDQISKVTLTNPCLPLTYLGDTTIIPYVFVLVCGFITANCAFLRLSTDLAKPPYSYHENTIGILYIPVAIAFLLGSVVGGKLSDLVAVKSFDISKILEGRMVPGLIFSLLTTIGLITYGWSIQYGAHISVPIIGQVVSGIGQAATRPGILSYITTKYQEHAASISSATNFLQQLLTAITLTFTGQIVQMIHEGPLFTILAVCNLLTTIVSAVIIGRILRLSKNPETKLLL